MNDTLTAALLIAAALAIGTLTGYLIGNPITRLALKTELALARKHATTIGRWLINPIGEPQGDWRNNVTGSRDYVGRHHRADDTSDEHTPELEAA